MHRGEYQARMAGVPSMHGGALFVTLARNLYVTDVHLTRLGGNAVALSEMVRDASFACSESEFSWIGDNGILQLGSVRFDRTLDMSEGSNDLMDGSDGMHPIGTSVKNCIFREIGCVWTSDLLLDRRTPCRARLVYIVAPWHGMQAEYQASCCAHRVEADAPFFSLCLFGAMPCE